MRLEQVLDRVELLKPNIVLEVGTWNGLMAKTMLKYGAKKYIGFDLFEEGSEDLDKIENNLKKRVDEKSVRELLKDYDFELIKGNTRQTLKEYVKDKKPFVDFAFIDGGHSKATIKSDLLNILTIMTDDGVVFLDDYYFNCPTPNVGAQLVAGELSIPYKVLPKVDRAKDGSLIKVIEINMKDVPRPNQWDMEGLSTWDFKP